MIIPGLVDAHFHPFGFALEETGLRLGGAADFNELAGRITVAASELPPGTPVLGRGLNDETLAERWLPTCHDLDKMVSGRAGPAQRLAVIRRRLDRSTPKPPASRSSTSDPVGDPSTVMPGMPTGILRETAAVVTQAIGDLAPVITAGEVLAARRAASAGARIRAIVSSGRHSGAVPVTRCRHLPEMAPDLPVLLVGPGLRREPRHPNDAASRSHEREGV